MQIIKEITIDLNKATSYSIAFSVRQGDKGGRFIKAYLTADKVPFNIPETFTAVVKGMIDDIVVADDEVCTIDRTANGKHFVLIPLTELMCAGYGNLELTLKLKEGEAVASAQSIWITVERDKTANAKENYATPINEVNAVLDEVITIEDETTTGLKREKLYALSTALNETAGVLAVKGVEVVEPFGVNDIPSTVENIATDGEYKDLVDGYKAQAEQAQATAETEKARADAATERAEIAEGQVETATAEATTAKAEAQAEKARADLAEEQVGDLTEQLEEIEAEVVSEKARADEADKRAVTAEGNFVGMIDKTITEVVIPEGVKEIGARAFADCNKLNKVVFNEGLIYIRNMAFENTALTEVIFPSTLKRIENYSFRFIHSLTKVIVNHGATLIGFTAFAGLHDYSKLSTLYLPNSLNVIQNDAFASTFKLEFITLEQNFNCSLNISASTLYSVETLVAMLEAIADLTGQTAKTLTIGATNLAKLTEEQIAIATNKNWTLA